MWRSIIEYFIVIYSEGVDAIGHLRISPIRIMPMSKLTLWSVLSCGVAKYINDIHGNTVVEDRSSGFHVFELHGYSVGVTSSVFMGVALLICATYLAFKLGLGRFLTCCCHNCNTETEMGTQSQVPAQ